MYRVSQQVLEVSKTRKVRIFLKEEKNRQIEVKSALLALLQCQQTFTNFGYFMIFFFKILYKTC